MKYSTICMTYILIDRNWYCLYHRIKLIKTHKKRTMFYTQIKSHKNNVLYMLTLGN